MPRALLSPIKKWTPCADSFLICIKIGASYPSRFELRVKPFPTKKLAGRTATQLNCLSEVEFNRALDRPRPLGCVGLGDPEDSLMAVNKCFDETLADLRLSIREDLSAQPHLASEHALLSVTEEAIERTDAPYLRVR